MEAEPAADFAPAKAMFSEECGFTSLLAEFAAPPAIRHHAETPATMIAGIDGPGPAVPDRAGAAFVENGLDRVMPGPDRCVANTTACRQAGRKKADDSHDRGPFEEPNPTCERAIIGHHPDSRMFSRRRDDMLEGGLWRVLNCLGDFLKIVNGPCTSGGRPTRPEFRKPLPVPPNQKLARVKPTGSFDVHNRLVDIWLKLAASQARS